MTEWEHGEKGCNHTFSGTRSGASELSDQCTRPVLAGHDLCPYHLEETDCRDINLDEDIRSRLEAIEAGELDIEREPLTFHDTTFDTLDLSEIDLSCLAGRNIALDFRNSTIESIRAANLSVPFPLYFSNCEIGTIEFSNSETDDFYLTGAEVGTNGMGSIRLLDTTVDGDIKAFGCKVTGDVSIEDGGCGEIIFERSKLDGDFAILDVTSSVLNLSDATLQNCSVIIRSRQIQNISGPQLTCQKINIKEYVPSRFDDTEIDNEVTATEIDLNNATASSKTIIEGLDVSKLVAKDFETLCLECKSFNLAPDQSVDITDDVPFNVSGKDIIEVNIVDVDSAGSVRVEGIRGEEFMIDSCRLTSFELEDVKLQTLAFKETICHDLSAKSTTVDEAKFIDEPSGNRTRIDSASDPLDQRPRQIRFDDCSLQSLQYELQCAELCMTDSTVDGTARIGWRDTYTPEKEKSKVESSTHRSINRLRVERTEMDELVVCGTVDDCLLYRIRVARSATFANLTCRSARIIDSELTNVDIDARMVYLSIFETDLPKHTRINLRNGSSQHGSVFFTESKLNKLILASKSSNRRIGLDRTYIKREARFDVINTQIDDPSWLLWWFSHFKRCETDMKTDYPQIPTVALTDVRIDGKLRYDSCVVQSVEHTATTIKSVDFEIQKGQIQIYNSLVSEMTTFTDCDLTSLKIVKSHLSQFKLTSGSSTSVVDEVVIEDSTLPNATMGIKNRQPEKGNIIRKRFDARNTTLRGADLTGLSADGPITLAQSNLTDAQLQQADLKSADLSNVLLSRASLAGTNLRLAKLRDIVFGDVNITDNTVLGVGEDKRVRYDPRFDPNDHEHIETSEIEEDPRQAKAIYGQLKAVARAGGYSELAQKMHRNEKQMELEISKADGLPGVRNIGKQLWYKTTGYEIGPGRVSLYGLALIAFAAFVFSIPVLIGNPQFDGGVFDAVMYSIGIFFGLEPAYYSPASGLQYLGSLLAGGGALIVAALIYTIGQRSAL